MKTHLALAFITLTALANAVEVGMQNGGMATGLAIHDGIEYTVHHKDDIISIFSIRQQNDKTAASLTRAERLHELLFHVWDVHCSAGVPLHLRS